MDSLKNHVQTALTALESSLDPKIWRTKLRVQEIMLEKNPDIKGNPFATHLNHLFTLLIA